MTEWHFWGDRKFLDVYGNIYLRTNVRDWFYIILKTSREFVGSKFVDIGCGEGHTTKQILDRIGGGYICDLVEPNKKALFYANKFLSMENKIDQKYAETLKTFSPKKKYDTIFTSHTNYYWSDDEVEFCRQLDKLPLLTNKGGKILILTLPEKSDHYKIMLKQVYPEFNYSEYIIRHYRSLGFNVQVKRFKMRMFVGDIITNKNLFDLKNFYRFIHNVNAAPTDLEAKKLLSKIKKYQKKGYLDFRDELIIVNL